MDDIYDVIIVGAGPAGLTAGIYCGRAKLRTVILEKESLGGKITNVEWIENYPGFPDGVAGAELGSQMMAQASKYGVEFKLAEVVGVELKENQKIVKTSEGDLAGRALIIAGGARSKKLGVPGEAEFAGSGVAYCALCDGSAFTNQVVAVAGGGDAGITEGLYLSRIASKVIVVELMPELTASKILQERALADPKIEIRCGTKIEAIVGDIKVRALALLELKKEQRTTLEIDGIFVSVGLEPNTDYLKGIVPLDSGRQVLVNDCMETQVSGVFAAGDLRHNSARQVGTAVGDGIEAALSATRFLKE